MVSIPARTVSCLTCRRRKKKCDKAAPTCSNCKKARKECDGYAHDLVWINRTVDNHPRQQTRTRQEHQNQQQGQQQEKQKEQQHDQQHDQKKGRQKEQQHDQKKGKQREQQICQNSPESSQHLIIHKNHSSSDFDSPGMACSAPSDIFLPLHLTQSAREQFFRGVFGSTMLAAGTSMPSDTAMSFASMGWTKHIAPLYEADPAVRHATLATSTAVLATMHGDKQLQVKGIQKYNSAVAEMAKGLQQTNWYKRDGLLAAARIMATFELLFISKEDGPDRLVWRGHNQGQQAIFLARGPAAFASGPPHQLYSDARINMVMLSMGQRKRSPFASPGWDKIPWTKHPKAVKDELIDLMQEIPEILEYVEEFKACIDAQRRQELETLIMNCCNEVRAGLDTWAAKRGETLRRFDCYAHSEPLRPPENDAEFALHHMTTIYFFTLGTISCIKSFFTSNQGQEHIPERPVGFYASYGGAAETLGMPVPMTSFSEEYDYSNVGTPSDFFSPASSGSSEQSLSPSETHTITETEHYLWEAAVYASREVYTLPFFFAPDAGMAHSAAGLMSLAVISRYYMHPAAFCVNGNEIEILQSLYKLPILGVPVGQMLERILGGFLPSLMTNTNGPRLSHGLGWF